MPLALLEAIRQRNTSPPILRCAIFSLFAFFQLPGFAVEGPTAQAPTPGQESSAKTILPDGTPIELRITKRLSTAQAKVGDAVEFEVVDDVKVGDLVVVPRHALASGVVTVVKPRRRPIRNAELRVDVRTVKSITGSEVAIRGTRVIMVDSKPHPADAAGIALLPVIPFLKGDEAFVSKGAKFLTYVSGDASFDPAHVRQNMTLLETKNAALLAAATAGKAEVHIYRHIPDLGPGNPTIYLDGSPLVRIQQGRYITLLLDAGAHTFRTDRSEVRLEFKAGEEYYVREEVHRSFWGEATNTHGPVHFTVVPSEQAEDEMYPLRPPDAKDIKDSNKLAPSEIRP